MHIVVIYVGQCIGLVVWARGGAHGHLQWNYQTTDVDYTFQKHPIFFCHTCNTVFQ